MKTTAPPPPASRRRLRRLPLLVAVLGVLIGAVSACSPFPGVGTKFADPGPYAVTVQTDAAHTYYSPTDLGTVKHPVVLWGNGTFLNPTHYDALLRHLASHGFIVAAANTSNALSGNEIRAGLDNLTTFNGQSGNRFYGTVDLTRVATVGHSQGGGGAITAGNDARIDTVVAVEPFLGNDAGVKGTIFYMAGENDTTITPASVRAKYDGTPRPAAYGLLAGASHTDPIVNGNMFRGPITAWLRWQLMGDGTARNQFVGECAYCSSSVFATYDTNSGLEAP
jgi:hypothetical protein